MYSTIVRSHVMAGYAAGLITTATQAAYIDEVDRADIPSPPIRTQDSGRTYRPRPWHWRGIAGATSSCSPSPRRSWRCPDCTMSANCRGEGDRDDPAARRDNRDNNAHRAVLRRQQLQPSLEASLRPVLAPRSA